MTLELSDTGEILSYEEYLSFGQTTYRAPVKHLGTPKLYRISGKENDAETGLVLAIMHPYSGDGFRQTRSE